MGSQIDLARAIEDFGDRVRARPAEAVGAELDRLVGLARSVRGGERYALSSPASNETWMQKVVLPAAQLQSNVDPLKIPYPCRLVGCFTTVLLQTFAQGIVEPPHDAIEVFLNIDRHEGLTMRTDETLPAGANAYVVKLEALDAKIANRLIVLEFEKSEQIMSMQVGWALDLTKVAAAGWGDVEVSLNWFVEPIGSGRMGK